MERSKMLLVEYFEVWFRLVKGMTRVFIMFAGQLANCNGNCYPPCMHTVVKLVGLVPLSVCLSVTPVNIFDRDQTLFS